jgi:hypothetical protein
MLLGLIPTKVHGVLDYMTSAMMVTLPRVLGWNAAPTRVLDIAAGGATAYSLATDYELGVTRQIPMKAHLTMDLISGAGLMFAAAYLLEDEDTEVRGTIAALGAFEVAAALMSHTRPSGPSSRRSRRRAERSPLLGDRSTDVGGTSVSASGPSSDPLSLRARVRVRGDSE